MAEEKKKSVKELKFEKNYKATIEFIEEISHRGLTLITKLCTGDLLKKDDVDEIARQEMYVFYRMMKAYQRILDGSEADAEQE